VEKRIRTVVISWFTNFSHFSLSLRSLFSSGANLL
jgi:hypothetical protein